MMTWDIILLNTVLILCLQQNFTVFRVIYPRSFSHTSDIRKSSFLKIAPWGRGEVFRAPPGLKVPGMRGFGAQQTGRARSSSLEVGWLGRSVLLKM